MEVNNNDMILIDLLNQLAQIQAQIIAIISTRFERQTAENVQNKVEQKQSNIQHEAQRYGQNPSLAEGAVSEYSGALEQIRVEYSVEKNLWLAQSEEFQKAELGYILEIARLKKELKSAKKQVVPNKEENADYKKQIADIKQILGITQESSRESQDNVRDCQDRCYKTIKDISEDKDLVKTDNTQNVFSKLFAKIKDRIGGKEKFNKNVIEPLKSKATHIKEEVLPKVKDKIQQNVMPKLKSLLEKGNEKVNEMNLKEKFSNLMSMAKEGAKSIAEKSSGLKEKAISAFSKGLSIAKEGLSKVAEKVSNVIESATEK